jgi:hypothetical protein
MRKPGGTARLTAPSDGARVRCKRDSPRGRELTCGVVRLRQPIAFDIRKRLTVLGVSHSRLRRGGFDKSGAQLGHVVSHEAIALHDAIFMTCTHMLEGVAAAVVTCTPMHSGMS